MSDQPNITVVYQYPEKKGDGLNLPIPMWLLIPVAFIVGVSFLCEGLAYLFH